VPDMTTLASAENAKQHPGKAASMSEGQEEHMCQSDQNTVAIDGSILNEGRRSCHSQNAGRSRGRKPEEHMCQT